MITRQLLKIVRQYGKDQKLGKGVAWDNLYNISKKFEPFLNLEGSQKIDIDKLSLKHLKDTDDLANVCKLEHGLDNYLNGELVFGDKGVGALPQQTQTTPNQIIAQLSGYVEPSQDEMLMNKTVQNKCRYLSSTSSISTPLITLYYLFSYFRTPQTENVFSEYFGKKPVNWMASFRKPATFFLRPLENDKYAIVSDHGVMPIANQVLMNLGHVIQYFLTHKKQDTAKLLSGEYAHNAKNYYRYAKVNGDLMLRSQIDCMSYNEKGDPYVFEIKSRACAPIRYDIENYKNYTNYEIDCKRGLYESFQREYFDLIRGGFLKYVMQVKIGRMDGAFIAYHNTQKIYGYQYVKLKEMALRVFGDEYNLDIAFLSISKMLTLVLDDILDKFSEFKKDELKIGFYAEYRLKKLIVMVQPLTVTKKYVPLTNKQNVKDIFDYFQNHQPLKNPFFKVQYNFFWFMNGVQIMNKDLLLTPYDSLELRFKASTRKNISKNEYIYFLQQSYKQDFNFSQFLYCGNWDLQGMDQQ